MMGANVRASQSFGAELQEPSDRKEGKAVIPKEGQGIEAVYDGLTRGK
jgi:hypothetical protein